MTPALWQTPTEDLKYVSPLTVLQDRPSAKRKDRRSKKPKAKPERSRHDVVAIQATPLAVSKKPWTGQMSGKAFSTANNSTLEWFGKNAHNPRPAIADLIVLPRRHEAERDMWHTTATAGGMYAETINLF